MFGFLKRKDKDKDGANPGEAGALESSRDKPAKKKRLPVKLIVIIFLVLIAVAGSGFVVYKFWFSAKPDENAKPVYKTIALSHVSLPEEMLKFSFDHFPKLYDALVMFNGEMSLIEQEIERIEQIAATYPEQDKL